MAFTHQPSAEQLTKQSLGLKGLNRLNHLAQCPFIELMRQRAAQTDNTHTLTHTHTHTCKHARTHTWMETHRATKQALNDDNNIYATPQGHFRERHLCARRRGRTTAADGAGEWGFLAAPCITPVATRLHTTQPGLDPPSPAEFFTTWPQFVP